MRLLCFPYFSKAPGRMRLQLTFLRITIQYRAVLQVDVVQG